MIAWICSFDPESTRPTLCQAISIQWPLFCTKLVGAGFTEMQYQVKFSSACKHSKHFIHGLMHIEGGLPYNGPLTQWQETTFAQHELYGKSRDAYAIKVTDCHWFTSPLQVYTRHTRAGGAQVQVRASCMAFYPSALEKLLSHNLEVEPQINQETPCRQQMCFTVHSFVQKLGVDPSKIQAVQLAVPLIPFLRQKRLTELVWFCSWPSVIEGFPPFWLHLQLTQLTAALHTPDAISPSSWEIWNNMLQTLRRMSCNMAPADKQLQLEASLMAIQIENVLILDMTRQDTSHVVTFLLYHMTH